MFPLSSRATIAYINDIPDYSQTNIRGNNSENGQYYCGPVAVSNSIVWLNNYKTEQVQLIHKLASKDYMNTDIKRGTRVSRLLRGIARITRELFGGYKTLEYEGWRLHPRRFSSGNRVPDIKRIKSAISRKSAAWINVGWYQYDKDSNEYKRTGGHWVTLVGYAYGRLILHDSAPRAGEKFANEFVEFSIIKNGTLVGGNAGLPFPARGLISLNKGMHKNKDADFAIVDGVVYLEI
jgi:hypothetical protein